MYRLLVGDDAHIVPLTWFIHAPNGASIDRVNRVILSLRSRRENPSSGNTDCHAPSVLAMTGEGRWEQAVSPTRGRYIFRAIRESPLRGEGKGGRQIAAPTVMRVHFVEAIVMPLQIGLQIRAAETSSENAKYSIYKISFLLYNGGTYIKGA